MRYLIFGGNGFIGSHLVDALLAQGHFVRVFGRTKVTEQPICRHRNLEYFEGDVTNEVDVSNAVCEIDICFHLVSTTLPQTSNDNPVFDVETNLISSINILRHAVLQNVRKVIFLSSGGTVYGVPRYLPIDEVHPTNPVCSYGIVKLAIEKYFGMYRQLYGLNCMILRLSNPYGPKQRLFASQGAIAVFLGKILREQVIEIWGDGTVIRDYIHISDVVDALMSAAVYDGKEYILNIGSGIGVDLNQLITTMEKVTGMTARRRYGKGRVFDVPSCILSADRARHELKWVPTIRLNEGIAEFAKLLRVEM